MSQTRSRRHTLPRFRLRIVQVFLGFSDRITGLTSVIRKGGSLTKNPCTCAGIFGCRGGRINFVDPDKGEVQKKSLFFVSLKWLFCFSTHGYMYPAPKNKKAPALRAKAFLLSGWPDLNRRLLRPERSALPGCATPRKEVWDWVCVWVWISWQS